MNHFWALVGNSQKLRKNKDCKTSLWWKLYVACFMLAGLVGYSVLIYQGKVGPSSLLVVIPYLLMINFGFSVGSIRQEWRGQTVAWWLTLPYSRLVLLLAKFVANFIRFLKITAVSIIALVVLALEGMLLNPAVWTNNVLSGVAAAAVKLYLLTITVSPASITLGIFLALMIHSRFKPLAPFVLAFVVSSFVSASNFVFHTYGNVFKGATLSTLPQIPPVLLPTYLGLASQLVISVLLLIASTYLLAEQSEV